ncbi:hypothetical protein O6H91_13G105600 [Diphasiastrum complanatum]|uniref:Uncharacterized protein n=1 Tax=Diphasiastrum complanatum TaxID=34168 RepID=A0ACC2BY63_DIPCM|nr:hypothetical protein O6H91_13G105600 [Diphasiastrum complanatum]
MQASGQYGVSEVQQFMVGRAGSGGHAAAAAHMFSLSHDVAAAVSPSSHSHSHPSQQQHHLQSHHQQHQSHQQQAHHQTAAASQTALQQQQQQQQQQQHHQQQQMMQQQQQLGLDPDSPDLPSPIATRQSPNSYNKQLVSARDSLAADEEGMEEGDRCTGGNRWPRQETLALIKIRTDMDASFRDAGLKGPLWEEVSRKLAELGFNRNAKKCKEKFENVHKYYKKTKEGKAGRQDGKSYRFFSQLEALYGGANAGSIHMSASKGGAGSSGGFCNPILKGGGGGTSAQRYADQDDEFNLSSESSGDEYDDPAAEDEPSESRKRKRKASWSSSEIAFFEGLVRKMMDKQEAMHRKFLEGIERREQERLIREDSWKRQEMARISREQELRAQERSLAATRDAALVAFLQKVTGQTLQLPHIPPQPSSKPQQAQSDDQTDKEPIDPNSKRWPKSEVLSLIRLRSGMEAKFQESGPKGSLWEAISAAMASLGYSRSPKRCKEKWENINKYFRKTKESSKKRPENAKTCPYFHQLDTLYRTGVLNSPSSKALKMEDQTNEMMGHHHHHHLGREEDSGQAQDEEEMLGGLIPSSGESAPNGVVLNSSSSTAAAAAIFSGQENGSNADRSDNGTAVAKMMNQKQTQLVDDGSGSGVNIGFERFPGVHEKQPLKQQLEGLVKEMMMDQQQQQQSGDGFEMRLDQAQQADDTSSHADQWQQQQQQQQEHLKLRSNRPNSKDAALIALVHKLASQAPDYPSISD